MAFSEPQQLNKLIAESKHILLTFASAPDVDAITTALAWKNFLEKQHKQADVVCENFVAPKNLNFLSGLNDVKSELSHLQKFIIKVDVSKAKIETLSYDVKDNWLSIYLTPRSGAITKNELRTAQSTFKYDLIITINSPDLNSLGEIFLNNTDLFYRVPVINIDHNSTNEHYGQLNLVDLTATSAAEITYKLLAAIKTDLINANIATLLLTGMIVKTHSFKTASVTPAALNLAGELINLGADRDRIIQNIYRTRSLASLKLWGQVLSHLQTDRAIGLVWSLITREDFARSGADENDLKEVVGELIANSPEIKLIFLIYEKETDLIKATLTANHEFNAKLLLRNFAPVGDKQQATVELKATSLKEMEEKLLDEIKKNLSR